MYVNQEIAQRLEGALIAWLALYDQSYASTPESWILTEGSARTVPITLADLSAAGERTDGDRTYWDIAYVIPVNSAEWEEWRGSHRWSTIAQRVAFVRTEKWVIAVSCSRESAQSGLSGFNQAPEMVAGSAKALISQLAGKALANGHTTDCPWDGAGIKFFATSGKRFNPLDPSIGTYGNYWPATLLTEENVDMIITSMSQRLRPNGTQLGVASDILKMQLCVPSALSSKGRRICDERFITKADVDGGQGGTAQFAGKLKLKIMDEYPNGKDWYIQCLGRKAMEPLAVTTMGAPEITAHGPGSPLYTAQHKVGVDGLAYDGVGLLDPRGISKASEP